MHDVADGTPVRGWSPRASPPPPVVDALIAVVVGGAELVNLHREVVVAGYRPPVPVGALAAGLAAVSLLLVWRRRSPVAVVVAVGLAAGTYGVIDLPTLNLPLLLVVFTAGERFAATALVGAALATGIAVVNVLRGTLSQLPIDLVVFGAVWLLGIHVRLRRQHATDLQRRQEAELWRARSHERTRLARELHDIVSNGVGGIYLEAAGAAGLAEYQPQRARSALDAIQTSARGVLDELRSLLDVLRHDHDPFEPAGERATTPTLRELPGLLARTRAAGATVEADIDLDPHVLPVGVSTVAYRTVQEALGNAVRHGRGGPISLCLATTSGGLRIEVVNPVAAPPPASPASGHWGLVGLRERITALGGDVAVRHDGDLFHLVAHLPAGDPGVVT